MAIRPNRKRAPHRGALFRFAPRWTFFLAAFATAAPATPALCPADHIDEYVHVDHIHDGDTIRLVDGRNLRFIGLNTPELARDAVPAEPLAAQARRALRRMIGPGKRVGLRYDTVRQDRYGRVLAHVYLETGESIVAQMLEGGYGAQIVVPPNLWNDGCYRDAEARAHVNGAGVWSLPDYDRAATRLRHDDRGFRVISGRITRVSEARSSLWLELDGPIALRIARNDLHYFDNMDFAQLVGHRVRVRGWVIPYRNSLMMQLRHPLALETLASE